MSPVTDETGLWWTRVNCPVLRACATDTYMNNEVYASITTHDGDQEDMSHDYALALREWQEHTQNAEQCT